MNRLLVGTGVAGLLLSIAAAWVVPQFTDASYQPLSGRILNSRIHNGQRARSQIELYFQVHQRSPWLPGEVAEKQWSVLGPLDKVPVNPLSPPGVASRIVEVTKAGDRGVGVDTTMAGWVWNSSDNLLWAAEPREGLEAWKRATDRSLADYINPSPFQMILAGVLVMVAMLFVASKRSANQAIAARRAGRP